MITLIIICSLLFLALVWAIICGCRREAEHQSEMAMRTSEMLSWANECQKAKDSLDRLNKNPRPSRCDVCGKYMAPSTGLTVADSTTKRLRFVHFECAKKINDRPLK